MLGESSTVVLQGKSSLPLQIFVYFSWHYTVFFFLINICLFTYKAVVYYYPGRYLGWDLVTIFLFVLVDCARLLLISKGNKTVKVLPLGASVLLALPLFVLHAYYIDLQTYVMKVDLVINAIAFFFLGIETFSSLYLMFIFRVASTRF
mmetsp:Transcript_8901/g.7946  ORF Transcript_8901/g.7946 Transcript_8901/m.7946 type:complete len:148 (+) Transcript_8901:51-494(+)